MACSAPTAVFHRIKADGQNGAKWRQRNQFQRGFGDNAEQAFRADKQAREIETGLVFVRATAGADDGAVGQHDFEAEDVITRDAVFRDSADRRRWWQCCRR